MPEKKLHNAQTKSGEFSIISSFPSGFRNREDKTNLPPYVLVDGSQNVLTNTAGRIGVRKGYALDGPADTTISSILAAYDYEVATGQVQHLRAGGLTSAGNDGKLQYRYDSGTTITWRDLETGQSSTNYNFTRWWDATLTMSKMLYVNHSANIREWSGGVTTVSAAGANTLTITGTDTWAQKGFYTTGTHTVVIAGVAYGATGGWGTTILTGVAPNPSAGGVVSGDIAHQKPETSTNSSMSLALSVNDLIEQLNNHVYVGSLTNNVVYISKDTDYKNYTYTTPVRLPGEGAILTLNSSPRAFVPQENVMYVSSGLSDWGEAIFTLAAANNAEAVNYQELNTVPLQGAQSQAMASKIRNNVLFISNEPIVTTWGRVDNVFPTPQTTDLSSPIVDNMNAYDFTDASIKWHKNFIYIAVPAESRVLVYNMTNPANPYWEAPQILPISRFYVVDGELYGHSYTTSESYKLFTGYNDNGSFIDARATFAFDNHGLPALSKLFTDYFIEGYISSNTDLTVTLQYDIDGCATNLTSTVIGSDTQVVCISTNDNSLGKFSLGSQPLGGNLNRVTSTTLPPKFRVIKTFGQVPYYEYQVTFSTNGIDKQWEVLRFGPAAYSSAENQSYITQ